MDPGTEPIERLAARTTALWAISAVFFVVGDLVTTSVGFMMGNVVEVGPLVAPVIRSHGIGVMIPLKVAAVGLCYLLWRATPSPHDLGVPLGLATLGVLVTGWNAVVLLLAAFPRAL